MKKYLTVLVLCLATCMFFSCSGGSSPKSVAKKALKCQKKDDVKGFVDCVYFKDSDKEYKDLYIQQIENNKKPSQEIESFEFVDEKIDEEAGRAKVTFNVTYKNGRTTKETFKMIRDDNGKWWLNQLY